MSRRCILKSVAELLKTTEKLEPNYTDKELVAYFKNVKKFLGKVSDEMTILEDDGK